MAILKEPRLSEDDGAPFASTSESGRSEPSPPTYELATTTAGSAYGGGNSVIPRDESDDGYPPAPPRHSQRALTPVCIKEQNRSVVGTFIVIDNGNMPDTEAPLFGLFGPKKTPEVELRSSNGKVHAQLWWQGFKDHRGTVRTETHSSNGSVKLSIPQAPQGGSGLDVQASSSNGRVTVLVPPTFHGTISLRSSNGKVVVSDSLSQKGLLMIPGEGKGEKRWQVGGEGGKDFVKAWSSNGRVIAGISGADDDDSDYDANGTSGRGCGCIIA